MNLEENFSKNQYKDILTVFRGFPLWLQQTLFSDFQTQINLPSDDNLLNDFSRKEIFALYAPLLTHIGEQEKNTRANKLPESVYTFLNDVSDGFSIVEMAIKNNLPLNILAHTFIKCLEREFITVVTNEKILHMANYLAGKIITIEFLCRIGKISRMTVNDVLDYQTRIQKKTGEKVDSVNILVAKKYISKEYAKSVLKYMVDSKRRIKDINADVIACNSDLNIETLKTTNVKLLQENKIIKEQLRKILNISDENE